MNHESRVDYHSIASKLSFPSQAFIAGQFVSSRSGKAFENINPATGQTIGHVTACEASDVDSAVKAARKAFEQGEWSRAAPETRKAVLLKLADLIERNADELATMESMDSGKTISDCLNEVGHEVPSFFRWYGELIDKSFGKVAPTGEDTLAFIIQEPVGVAGIVLPWNFPLLMAAWKLAPALAAGCSVVVKPAEQTPLTALRLGELAAEAGLPDGVLNILPGFGETAGRAIGLHPDIDVVSFTGSTEVGGLFLRYSSESNLKPVGLEMGGKSPFIVLEDAPLDDRLISDAVSAALWNGGQNCSANMRQFVPASRKDEFLSKILERVEGLKVGDPLDPDTEMGSMVTKEHQSRVLGYIETGRKEGASILAGGGPVDGNPGFYVRPTVFDDVKHSMTIATEEIFGPVLGVIAYQDTEEALRMASDSIYGLHATVFTRDIDRAMHFARRLPCGTVSVNRFSEGDIKTPFGGYKRSGSLARDNGTEAMQQYLQTKTIWIAGPDQ